ncbi:hypothetical protein JAAARDRAFT_58196 [Jaapia argillacea MUCL 33604]|uniref:Peptidase A22B, signal peptide peptidase n=1 Tax=Jaapia argillacea MUCL 33604 TaxID=933084 RepID=A0A067Q293_9AGAM|nr:hypothetical protein JAAARDRAFT_58196 [Jaapia argillacea MUCL 33604]
MDGPDWDLISSYAGLVSLATASIVVGAFASLSNSAQASTQSQSETSTTEGEGDEEEDNGERLSSEDAWLFPILGSVVLFGLYLVVKHLGKEWINWLLRWYFAIAGIGSVSKSSIALVKVTLGVKRWKAFDRTKILVLKGPRELLSLSWRSPSFLILPVAAIPSLLYTFHSASRKSALLSNLLALSFSHNALSLLKLDSFKTGCILLSGLFFYDIWWVFGTEVMLKVATTLDVPIKLLWPKSMFFSGTRGYTMLGLGDVVIPGTFISLALRYDYHRSKPGQPIRRPYFIAAVVAYIAGLVTTMTVMHCFRKAQPALLYLSPACILSFFITAVFQGELQDAWSWSDERRDGKGKSEAKDNLDSAVKDIANPDTSQTEKNGLGDHGAMAEHPSQGEVEVDGGDKPRKRRVKKKV